MLAVANVSNGTELKVKRSKNSARNLHNQLFILWSENDGHRIYSNFHIIYMTHNILGDIRVTHGLNEERELH